jgi:hypothetical protein
LLADFVVDAAFPIVARIFPGKRVSSEMEAVTMTIILNSEFATAEDTAKELGVPRSRLKRLVRLVHERVIASSRRANGNKIAHKNGARLLTSTRKRKDTRGKAKKAAR